MGKYVIITTSAGTHFNMVSGNNKVIATSEVYTTEQSCLEGIKSVMDNVKTAGLCDSSLSVPTTAECPKFEIYKDKAGCFRFRYIASNGRIVIFSQAYSTKAACKNGIESVINNADSETILEVTE